MKQSLALFALVALSALPLSGQSAPGSSPAEAVVNHHMSAVGSGKLDDVMSDYADNAVMISPNGVAKGKQAIRGVFETLLKPGPNALAPIELKTQVFEGEFGYITWAQNTGKPGEQKGSDTFVLRNGKIALQTVMFVPTAAAK